jgi:hypothetical protein
MGMSVSWIGVQSMDRERILDALGLMAAPSRAKGRKATTWSFSNGWTFVLSTDFNYPTPKRMAALSADGTAIALSVDDRVMVSVVRGYERGKAVFAIERDGGQKGVRHMAVAGTAPAEWAAIRKRLTEEQDEEDRGESRTDFLFDAPLELAKALCGYRFDEEWPKGQKPVQTALVKKKTPSLLSRLFGKRWRPTSPTAG